MREILFRGKRINSMKAGEWAEGFFMEWLNPCKNRKEARIQTISEGGCIDLIHEVDPSTVGQYTGLKDKNGKRIFEGDVVSYKRVHQFTEDDDIEDYGNQFPDKISDCLGVVEFRNGKFMPLPERHDCDDYWYSDGQYGFEVIGNIHDNPEMLEER